MSIVEAPPAGAALHARAQVLYEQHCDSVSRKIDRWFAGLLIFQWFAGVIVALWISPFTWAGTQASTHPHVWAAALLGGLIISFPLLLILTRPGAALTRHVVAVSQMLASALFIHLSGGRIETHFHVFGSLTFLAFYRDWPVLVTASVVIAADHFLRGLFWPQSVYGTAVGAEWRWLEHAGWVVFIDLFLVQSCLRGVAEARAIALRQAELEAAHQDVEQQVLDRTAELRDSEERTRAVVNNLFDGVVTINEDGIVETFNPAAEKIFGYRAAEVVGHNIKLLMPESYHDRHDAGLARC
ncbi:MAG: PAS domain S-box protein, partial [Planctomycetes bacterium]|nr:PAS domain S-box protein [Planctomycetota bacterium]